MALNFSKIAIGICCNSSRFSEGRIRPRLFVAKNCNKFAEVTHPSRLCSYESRFFKIVEWNHYMSTAQRIY
jgi:hypothetical protein